MRVGSPNLFVGLDISASALSAQRTRMNVIAQNLANINTTRDAQGNVNPYRRQEVTFSSGSPLYTNTRSLGVQVKDVIKDSSELKQVYRPGHPDANDEGYVMMPNVEIAVEMVDMIEATRAYEANVTAMDATKENLNRLLRILS